MLGGDRGHPVDAECVGPRRIVGFLDESNADEKAQLNRSLEDIVAGGARTELGVFRFKALTSKARDASRDFLYKIAVDIASETASKMLKGSP
jgi:hypothetical protein